MAPRSQLGFYGEKFFSPGGKLFSPYNYPQILSTPTTQTYTYPKFLSKLTNAQMLDVPLCTGNRARKRSTPRRRQTEDYATSSTHVGMSRANPSYWQ